jgi:hypothetical protein
MNIHFVHVGGPYTKILDTMIDPIREHLPDSTMSRYALPDCLNVTFFVEKHIQNFAGKMIFISHGIADKGYRDIKNVECFDYVCVSGPTWVDKMVKQGFPEDRILMNGYTKLDPIFQGKVKRTPGDKPGVLWAPTHNSVQMWSSYPYLNEFVNRLPNYGYDVMVSAHPANKADNKPTFELMVDADIVIADSGSTLYEAWALGKQVIFPDWLIRNSVTGFRTLESYIFKNNIGLHANNEDDILRLIECGLKSPLPSSITNFMEGILPTSLRGHSGAKTAELLKVIANV